MRRAATALLVLGASCGGDSAWSGTVETLPNGAAIVRNPEFGLWTDAERWRIVEDLRIGSVDGSGADVFGNPMALSLAVSSDGDLFVLDGQSNEIRVFDASGAHVRSFGRAGSGPGEMRSAYLAGVGPEGNLLVVDQGNSRYTVFSPAGQVVATHPRPIRLTSVPWRGSMDTAGRVLDIGARGRAERALVRLDPAMAAADTFPLPDDNLGAFQILNDAGLPRMSVRIPFAGQPIWTPDRRGHVWSAVTDRYRIVRQSFAGDTLLVVERAARPIPVTDEERAAEIARLKFFVDAGGRVDASRIPDTRPILESIAVDDRGYLWVVAQPYEAQGRAYEIFDPGGRYLGQVAVPASVAHALTHAVFRGAHLYGFTRDSLDVPYVVRLRIDGR